MKSLPPVRSAVAIALVLTGAAIAPVVAQTTAPTMTPGVAPLACPEQTQLAMNRCAGQWQRTADFFRSLVYEEVYWDLPVEVQPQLALTEQAWNLFQENHCLQANAAFRDGSIYPLLYSSCKATLINDRIADLQAWNNPQLTATAADRRLNALLIEEHLTDSYIQQQWQHYQTRQCQLEVARFPNNSEQAEQCRHRITESRIRQLETRNGLR